MSPEKRLFNQRSTDKERLKDMLLNEMPFAKMSLVKLSFAKMNVI